MAKTPEKLPRGITITYRNRRGVPTKLYQVRVTWQGQREYIGRYEALQDAKAAKLLADADILRGIFVPPSAIRAARRAEDEAEFHARVNAHKVGQLAEDWLRHLERMGTKQSTLYTYRRRIERHVLPYFTDLPVEAVTPTIVQTWFDELDARLGNGVSRGAYMNLSAMFSYATGQARGQSPDFEPLIDRSPCRVAGASKHKPVKDIEEGDETITTEQVNALAAAMPKADALAVLLGGFMAQRIGEVLGLQRRDVADLATLRIRRALQSRGAGLVTDTPKTKAGTRNLPIPKSLRPIIEQHLKNFVAEAADAPLFPRTPKGDEYLHPNVLRTHFAAAVATVNSAIVDGNKRAVEKEPVIPSTFVFHGLRHTALTRIGELGATLEELKLWAGHTDSKSVERYQHASRKRLASLADSISEGIK